MLAVERRQARNAYGAAAHASKAQQHGKHRHRREIASVVRAKAAAFAATLRASDRRRGRHEHPLCQAAVGPRNVEALKRLLLLELRT